MKRIVTLLLVVVFSATACGGGSKATTTSTTSKPPTSYEAAMQAVGTKLGKTLHTVEFANLNVNAKPAASIKRLQGAQVALRTAAADLAKIDPPANVKSSHEALRAAVLQFATDLDVVIANIRKQSPDALVAMLDSKGLKNMAIASAAITKKGYDISRKK